MPANMAKKETSAPADSNLCTILANTKPHLLTAGPVPLKRPKIEEPSLKEKVVETVPAIWAYLKSLPPAPLAFIISLYTSVKTLLHTVVDVSYAGVAALKVKTGALIANGFYSKKAVANEDKASQPEEVTITPSDLTTKKSRIRNMKKVPNDAIPITGTEPTIHEEDCTVAQFGTDMGSEEAPEPGAEEGWKKVVGKKERKKMVTTSS